MLNRRHECLLYPVVQTGNIVYRSDRGQALQVWSTQLWSRHECLLHPVVLAFSFNRFTIFRCRKKLSPTNLHEFWSGRRTNRMSLRLLPGSRKTPASTRSLRGTAISPIVAASMTPL